MIDDPLLTGEEITSLLFAAPAADAALVSRHPRQGRSGGRPAALHGSGMDFADLRAYQMGDDPRNIDWRATARSTQPLMRVYNADLASPVYLLIDRRSGMRFGTRKRLKVTQAVRAALWLGGREARAGHEVAGIVIDSPCRWSPRLPGMEGIKGLAEWATAPCSPIDPGIHEPGWRKVLAGLRQRLPQDSRLWMCSDFAGLSAADVGALRSLGQHCEVTAIHINDPMEALPQLPYPVEYHWGSQDMRIEKPVSDQSQRFLDQRQAYADFLVREFSRAGIVYQALASDQDALIETLHGR